MYACPPFEDLFSAIKLQLIINTEISTESKFETIGPILLLRFFMS